MNKIKRFKKDDKWDMFYFYYIFEKNGKKYIKINGETDRSDNGKNYLSFVYRLFSNCVLELNEFLMWDVYYQLEKLIESQSVPFVEDVPIAVYEIANYLLTIDDKNGSSKQRISDINVNTMCGSYYGI